MRPISQHAGLELSPRAKKILPPFFLAFSVAEAIYTWHDVGKPYSWNTGTFSLIIGHVGAISFLLLLIVELRWFRARLALTLSAITLAIGFVANLAAVRAEPAASSVRIAVLLVWIAVAVVSLSMCFRPAPQ